MDDYYQSQQRIYNQTWADGIKQGKEQRGNLDSNLKFLNRSGLIKSDKKILEVGCGAGGVVNETKKRGCRVIGTDISNIAVEYGRKKFPGIELKVGLAEKLEFMDSSFDLVLSFDVLEHLAEVDKHLEEVRRVLVDGGYYLLQTPNKYSNSVYETLKLGSIKWRRYHPSLHTAGQLKHRFNRHGFDVRFVKMPALNKYSLDKLKYNWLKRIAGAIDFGKLPLMTQTNFYVVARKKATGARSEKQARGSS